MDHWCPPATSPEIANGLLEENGLLNIEEYQLVPTETTRPCWTAWMTPAAPVKIQRYSPPSPVCWTVLQAASPEEPVSCPEPSRFHAPGNSSLWVSQT